MKMITNNKKGMEMVQVAILVAIAIGLGLLFKEQIGEFITNTFESLNSSNFNGDLRQMMKIRSRKGTTMVEAAMIFPLVIAAVIAVIYIVLSLYSSLSLQASLHLALRKEGGELSQTTYRLQEMKEFQSKKDSVGIRPVLRTEWEREYRINTLFQARSTRKAEGRVYLVDEAERIRILYFKGEGT